MLSYKNVILVFLSSTSFSGGYLVDSLPPASSIDLYQEEILHGTMMRNRQRTNNFCKVIFHEMIKFAASGLLSQWMCAGEALWLSNLFLLPVDLSSTSPPGGNLVDSLPPA